MVTSTEFFEEYNVFLVTEVVVRMPLVMAVLLPTVKIRFFISIVLHLLYSLLIAKYELLMSVLVVLLFMSRLLGLRHYN